MRRGVGRRGGCGSEAEVARAAALERQVDRHVARGLLGQRDGVVLRYGRRRVAFRDGQFAHGEREAGGVVVAGHHLRAPDVRAAGPQGGVGRAVGRGCNDGDAVSEGDRLGQRVHVFAGADADGLRRVPSRRRELVPRGGEDLRDAVAGRVERQLGIVHARLHREEPQRVEGPPSGRAGEAEGVRHRSALEDSEGGRVYDGADEVVVFNGVREVHDAGVGRVGHSRDDRVGDVA